MSEQSEQPPIRAGVIGVGSMGQNHVRVYRELPETTLVGVHDVNMEQAGLKFGPETILFI